MSRRERFPAAFTELSIDSLVRYTSCPLRYLYQDYAKLPFVSKPNPQSVCYQAVKKAVLFTGAKLATGEIPYPDEAIKEFEDNLLLEAGKAGIPFADLANELADGRIRTRGMYNVLMEPGTTIIATEVPVAAKIRVGSFSKPRQLSITGTVDVVRKDGRRRGEKIQLLEIYQDERRRTQFEIANSPRSILTQKCMIETALQNDRFSAHNWDAVEVGFLHLKTGVIDSRQVDRDLIRDLPLWLYNVVKAIESNIYYPNVSLECNECPYKNQCNPKDVSILSRLKLKTKKTGSVLKIIQEDLPSTTSGQ